MAETVIPFRKRVRTRRHAVSRMPRDPELCARVLEKVKVPLSDAVQARRRMLAELCHSVACQVGVPPRRTLSAKIATEDIAATAGITALPLREQQTLQHLLAGDSEKQVAHKLQISRNTVHVYITKLYRRFGVNSRGELLAKWVGR